MRRLPHATVAAGTLALSLLAANAWSQAAGTRPAGPVAGPEVCGSLQNHYGPYDYRTQRDKLLIVEQYHFDAGVEALVRGMTTDRIGGDISYTLATSPNHHRALMATIRLGEKLNNPHPPAMRYSVECYLERGLRFRPDDTVVRQLYAQWLAKQGRRDEALRQLGIAVEYAQDSALTHHNIGMIYLDLGESERALQQARKAAALGFDGNRLEDRLRRAGLWQDGPEPTAAAASAP
jgi:tetratricopeptide (TPR) repeat protein